jgi:two-component system, NarL family, response regulator LiaR
MLNDKQGPSIKILLADDHSVVRAGIRQFLEQNRELMVVAETGDGKMACELLKQHLPDVAMLDIQMPGMSGIEVTRWIRQQELDIRVLILSAYDDIPFVQAAVNAGADGYMIKTAEPAEIVDAVFRIQRGEKVFSSDVKQTMENQHLLRRELDRPLLTLREQEVLTLTAGGFSNKQIANKLDLSERTVQNHIAHIFHRLGVSSRTEAVMKAMSIGLLSGPPVQMGS